MKKALFICTYGGFISSFEVSNIKILQSMGYEVHVAANFNDPIKNDKPEVIDGLNIVKHHINFQRNVFSFQHIRNFSQLDKLIRKYKFDEVDCHNPVCGVLGRICAKKNRVTNIVYTAHGFHFYKGAPLKNWILYYPIEWLCSWWTDILITINNEDYERAKKHFHMKKLEKIPGVGVDIDKFSICKVDREKKCMEIGISSNRLNVSMFSDCNVDKEKKCKEIGISKDKFILLSVGELQIRKNHLTVIEALHRINNKNIVYLIAGQGELKKEYEEKIKKYGLENEVKLLGFRKDIAELCKIADCFVFPSAREGLGMAPLEAMASGLPLISSYVGGIKDYTENGKTGCCIMKPIRTDEYIKAINIMYRDTEFRKKCGIYNEQKVLGYSIYNTSKIMKQIYEICLST